MGLFGKKKDENFCLPDVHLSERIAKIPTEDLMAWVETSVYNIQRSLTDWRRAGDVVALAQAKDGAYALLAVLDECVRRLDAEVPPPTAR